MVLEILFWVYVGVAVVQLFYHLFFFLRFGIHKHQEAKMDPYPVSVIVAARNEEDNLQAYLPHVLCQKGVEYEVVVSDDCSVDDTLLVLKDLETKYPNLRHTRLQESKMFEGGKKYALALGIKAAKYENLIFTDADCEPASENWLKHMADGITQRKVVLGYAPFFKEKGVLNKLIRFDAFNIGLQYLSFALGGIPYMGVGRNMGYKSHMFFDQKGFSSHYDIKSGDDDLFLNAVVDRKNTKVVLHPETFVFSKAKQSMKDWIFQKRRHITTSPRYRFLHLLTLGLLSFSQYALFGLLFVLLVTNYRVQETLIVIALRYLIQQLVYFLALKKTNELDLMPIAAFFEPFYMIFYPVLVFMNVLSKSNEWKR